MKKEQEIIHRKKSISSPAPERIYRMLSKQDKINIYGLLQQEFTSEEKTPLAKVALYLNGKGLHYQEFGYSKLKSLLSDCHEFLTLSESQEKGHVDYVTLHSWKSHDVFVADKKKEMPAKDKKQSPSQRKEIPLSDQKKIYSSLKESFETKGEYPMALIAQKVNDSGFNHHEYGYGKMKDFLTMLPFLSMREVTQKGVRQSMVSIHPFLKETEKKTTPKAESRKPVASSEKPSLAVHEKRTALPPKDIQEFVTTHVTSPLSLEEEENPKSYPVLNIPSNLLLSAKEITGLGLDDKTLKHKILEDINALILKKPLSEAEEETYLFPLTIVSKNKEPLVASMKRAGKHCSYAFYMNYLGPDKEKPRDVFRDQIRFTDFDKDIQSLAELAKSESWCYKNSKDPNVILKIYLQYTFFQLVSQNKVLVEPLSGFVCFNTGLVSKSYDPIYAVLLVNHDPSLKEKYLFQGFTLAASQGLGKIIVEHFSPLPERATYITKPQDLFFDYTKQLHIDYQHIILDNLDRFPLSFLKNLSAPFEDEKKLLSQISREKSDFSRQKLFEKLEEDVKKNTTLFAMLRACFDSAVSKAIKAAGCDLRYALPSFFPTRSVMSIMLPLSFDEGEGPEAALLCELMPSGSYQGQTILTLKQCYVNARLIGPLSYTFLKAKEIED